MVSKRSRLVRDSARRRRPAAAPAPTPFKITESVQSPCTFAPTPHGGPTLSTILNRFDGQSRDRAVPVPPPRIGCSAVITAGAVPVDMVTSQRVTGKAPQQKSHTQRCFGATGRAEGGSQHQKTITRPIGSPHSPRAHDHRKRGATPCISGVRHMVRGKHGSPVMPPGRGSGSLTGL